jgi:hypothetical protein
LPFFIAPVGGEDFRMTFQFIVDNGGNMRRLISFGIVIAAVAAVLAQVTLDHTPRARTPVKIPDVLGYQTLKCDFHIHTVFSDGSVWPNVRPEEAWREGLDAIAITDHIEYQPHKEDLPTNHERSFQIARPRGDLLEITVIRGSEITRDMPPGHINAIFLESVDQVDQEEWRDAVKAAHDQGAFIFWNHPGWEGQQPDKIARWYPEHTELVENRMLHGIEVVNSREYYPEAHQWCIEKNLTLLSNSDIHNPLNLDYHVHHGDHRPITLVFARDKTGESIKEALFARRTAVYSHNTLIGNEEFLRAIFGESIQVVRNAVTVRGTRSAFIQIRNDSDISYELVGENRFPEIEVPDELVLQAGKTVLLEVGGTTENSSGLRQFSLLYTARNLLIAPDQGMPVQFNIEVTLVPVTAVE